MKEKLAITNQSVSLRRTLTREQCDQVFNELKQAEGIHRDYARKGFPLIGYH